MSFSRDMLQEELLYKQAGKYQDMVSSIYTTFDTILKKKNQAVLTWSVFICI